MIIYHEQTPIGSAPFYCSPYNMAATNEPFVNVDTDDSFSVSSLSMTDTLDPVLPHASASVPHVDVWVRDCDDPVSLAHANLS